MTNQRLKKGGSLARRSRFFAVAFLAAAAGAGLAQDAAFKYRVSYRKMPGLPWTFYADVRDHAKAERIAEELKNIGFEPQVEGVSAGQPSPPKPQMAPPPPALPPAPPPERTTMSYNGGNFYPTPHVITGANRPGYQSSVFALGNGPITSYGMGVGWGWGGYYLNNPMSRPQLNEPYGPARPMYQHPTMHPGF